ncbi:hypothetical protein Hanom_Chr08g00711861 [Helianthus anomalus]
MSWFDLNYVFGKSSGNNTGTFIPESSEMLVVPDSYDWSVKDDHAEEVVSDFRSYHKEPLLPDLNEVVVPSDDYVTVVRVKPRTNKKTMATTFSLVMLTPYNKTLVSLFTTRVIC